MWKWLLLLSKLLRSSRLSPFLVFICQRIKTENFFLAAMTFLMLNLDQQNKTSLGALYLQARKRGQQPSMVLSSKEALGSKLNLKKLCWIQVLLTLWFQRMMLKQSPRLFWDIRWNVRLPHLRAVLVYTNVSVKREIINLYNHFNFSSEVSTSICPSQATSKETTRKANANFYFIHMTHLTEVIQNGCLEHNFYKITIQFMIWKNIG